jgi:hypothetical protein
VPNTPRKAIPREPLALRAGSTALSMLCKPHRPIPMIRELIIHRKYSIGKWCRIVENSTVKCRWSFTHFSSISWESPCFFSSPLLLTENLLPRLKSDRVVRHGPVGIGKNMLHPSQVAYDAHVQVARPDKLRVSICRNSSSTNRLSRTLPGSRRSISDRESRQHHKRQHRDLLLHNLKNRESRPLQGVLLFHFHTSRVGKSQRPTTPRWFMMLCIFEAGSMSCADRFTDKLVDACCTEIRGGAAKRIDEKFGGMYNIRWSELY